MSKTQDNLQEAFAGESQANRKYLAFAKQADKEGYSQIARLFRAAAAAETVHAHAHLRAMGGIGTTQENLEEAVSGETYEFKSMYPNMIEAAKEEGKQRPSDLLSTPMRLKKFTPNFIRMRLITWTRLKRLITTFAQYADLPVKKSRPISARCAVPKQKLLLKSNNALSNRTPV